MWFLLAILLTAGIVTTGLDWRYFLATRNQTLQLFLIPAMIVGGLLPIALPLLLWGLGSALKNKVVRKTAFALGQSAMMGSLISSLLKMLTGRIQPNLLNLTTDSSRDFQFGFLRHGIFWGWPSSHTTIAFAMAVTLVYLFPKKQWLAASALGYALYIGIGVSTNIHWFSEFIAGAIIGSVIGSVVGKSFKEAKKIS